MVSLSLFLALSLATLGLAPSQTRAACECGYFDPNTGSTWTDASITYFNETGMQDIVALPAKSPRILGQETIGDTGTGQETWAVVGDHVNEWETSFGATWRTAVSYNNTFIDKTDSSLGLAMQVSTPDLKHRIVNGSQMVTRRRDIHYGSFRAYIMPPPLTGEGSGFKWAVAYNDSETIDMSLYTQEWNKGNGTLWWSHSSTGVDSKPFKQNATYLGANFSDFLEHRLEWVSPKLLQWRHEGTNDTSNFRAVMMGKNVSNVPTTPAPVSFQAWANGEPSMSQGPPIHQALLTHIQWTRFFFNSSLAQRHDQFQQSCAAAGASAVCSTEDYSLRDSTPFTMESIAMMAPVKNVFKSPLWAIIAESLFGGVFIILLFHGLFIRRVKAVAKTKAAALDGISLDNIGKARNSEEEEEEHDMYFDENPSVYFSDPFRPTSQNSMAKSTDKLFRMSEDIAVPELWDDSEFDSDEEAELDEVDEVYGDIEGGVRALRYDDMPLTLPSFESIDKNALGFSAPAVAFTHDDKAEQLRRYARHNGLGSGYFAPSLSTTSLGPKDTTQDAYSPKAPSKWQQRTRKAQILRWRARPVGVDSDPVGQLAQPVAADHFDRRPSVMFVRQTMLQAFYSKVREVVFIKGSTLKTSTGESRIDYLDGMRGFACLFVSLGHFILIFYYGIADSTGPKHYPRMETWVRALVGPIIINAGLVLGIFFVLPSRTMCMRYLLKGGVQSMADSTIRRIPRLIIPVAGACLANYFMIDIDAYKWVPRLASRTWSVWSYWQSFDNVLVFLNALITLWWASPPVSPALVTGYATGVLWTIPVIVQGMWTCMLSALVAHELKRPWKRFLFYGACVGFSWYANSWDQFFMAGLIIADLDANLHYRKFAAIGFPVIPRQAAVALGISQNFAKRFRIRIGLLAWVFFFACCVQQWLAYIPNAPAAYLDLQEYGIHPDFGNSKPHDWNGNLSYMYTNPRVNSWFFVMSVFLLVDLSETAQTFFRLRIWNFLGKHSMAYFLCHGIVFWTWGAWLCITMLVAGVPYWLTILTVFITSYAILTAFCIAFTYTFEYWAILFSKAVWRHASGNLGRKV